MFLYVVQTQYYEIFDAYWKDIGVYNTKKEARKKVQELRNAAWFDGEIGTKFRVVKRIGK
ncbi:hypothetical protein MKY51_15730 [Solibacillus sp. FSL R5-0691]|uniref:hypothetical protein n=1 Tax=Solibacillus sp. FSL R5-0691 TaxID=2921653 RepID=UPI0030D3CFC3